MISQQELKKVVHYDPITGEFTWKETIGRRANVGEKAGCFDKHLGYVAMCIYKKRYLAHRLAFLYMHGHMPEEVDHVNHVRHDNSWVNLRPATRKTNSRNKSKQKNNSSGETGIYWSKCANKWQAYIIVDTKHIHLGLFTTLRAARKARKRAEEKYNFHENHGEDIPCT